MKRYTIFFKILSVSTIIFMSGCAYHLRYTIKSDFNQRVDIEQKGKTFAVEPRTAPDSANFQVESDLLHVIEQNLKDLGWRAAPANDAEYIFQVDFETENIKPDFGFGAFFGGDSGFYLFGQLNTVKSDYSNHFIKITAYETDGERVYTWSVDITTGRVSQDIKTLAVHMIPSALSRFPEQGQWEMREKVHLHKKK
jgi:hypothetical protein